jgi:hypothetical protein
MDLAVSAAALLVLACWGAAATSAAWEARMGERGGATNPSTTQEAREKSPIFIYPEQMQPIT